LILDAGAASIKITDLSGQILTIGKGNRIDVRPLPPGMYIITTDIGWGKFVKM
jgi:hypothetical protein